MQGKICLKRSLQTSEKGLLMFQRQATIHTCSYTPEVAEIPRIVANDLQTTLALLDNNTEQCSIKENTKENFTFLLETALLSALNLPVSIWMFQAIGMMFCEQMRQIQIFLALMRNFMFGENEPRVAVKEPHHSHEARS